MPKPAHRRLTLPAPARTASVEKHAEPLAAAIHRFFILRANAIATTAAELYARAIKADEDQVKRILSKLGLDDWTELSDTVHSALIAVFAEGGASALGALGISDPDLFDVLNVEARDYARARGAELVGMRYTADGDLVVNPRAEWAVSESTRDGLRDLITRAFDEGLSPQQLSEEIQDSYLFSSARSDLISRTELSFAHTQGSIAAMKESGVVTGKSLVLSDGHEISDDCDDAEAQGVVPLDDDSIDPPLHPNCLVGGTVVSAAGVAAQYSRRIRGEVVRLLIEGPDQLAVTPNHPILTRRGWVAAGALQKGDDLIACSDPGLAALLLNPYDHHIQAAIEEIGRSLLVSGGVESAGVPLAAEDFHGDVSTDEEVEIVRAARLLMHEGKTAAHQFAMQPILAGGHSSSGPLAGLGASAQLGKRMLLAPDGSVGRLGSTHPDGSRHPACLDDMGFALGPNSEPVSTKRLPNREAMASETLSKIDARLAGLITTRKLLDLSREQFSGHVYNLSTECGWFTASGIIVHNCECTLIYETAAPGEEEAA